MVTRLEDAVIAVRIETGRARSQLHSLKSDVGDLGERQRMIRQRAIEAGGAYMPGVPTRTQAREPDAKQPGRSAVPGSDTGSDDRSPGELKNPLRYLQNVRSLQEIAMSKSPGEIMSRVGGIMTEMGKAGGPMFAGGLAIQGFAKLKRIMAGAMETKQFFNMGEKMVGTALARDHEDRDEWFGGSRREMPDSADWVAKRQRENEIIGQTISMEESFAETRAMTSATALVGGKAFSAQKFTDHFNRFADYHEFMYEFNRRNRMYMQMEAGTSIMEDTIGTIGAGVGWGKFAETLMLGRYQ